MGEGIAAAAAAEVGEVVAAATAAEEIAGVANL